MLLYNDGHANVTKEDFNVAYETKVLLSLLADTALRTGSKEMWCFDKSEVKFQRCHVNIFL